VIDFDALVLGPAMATFGEAVWYVPGPRSPIYTGAGFEITGVYDHAYVEAGELGSPGVNTTRPVLGVQLSQFPAGFDPENAQKDTFTVLRTGETFVVKSGKKDSHGGARLDANAA
jgi:hypothetical protein